MLRRFGIGLIKGLLVGGLVLSALLFGLKMAAVPVWAAYLLAVGSGALIGLVAGKPIWLSDKVARIEAGLKAVAGMLLGAFGLFALSRWAPPGLLKPEALQSALPAHGAAQALSGVGLAFIPVITMVLGLFFELDNTPAPEEKKDAKGPAALAGPRARVSSETPSPEAIDELLEESTKQSSQRRDKR